jgi:murein DD-endopeptidase / murein LD-carboxypeptidase
MKTDVVARARGLVGVRFRAQGRDPAYGLDCLGLALAAYAIPSEAVRRDYRLRGDHKREVLAGATGFRRVSRAQRRAGDLLLLEARAGQTHLAVWTGDGFVHADARLGKVVETPGEPGWPVVAVLRRRTRKKR